MNIAEQFAALLPGVEISEEFVAKLTASIETAVAQRVDEQTKAIEEKAEEYVASIKKEMEEISEKANAYAEYVVNEMTQKVDDYCDFVIEQFVEENRQKLVETEEYCRMNKVLRSIREAFETNYFQLSTEPANRDLSSKLQEQKEAFNQLFEEHRQLKNQVEAYSKYVEEENRKEAFKNLTEGLADTQINKIASLIEKASFPDTESFKHGVSLMVEEFKSSKASSLSPSKTITETFVPSTTVTVDERMNSYLSRL
jgi:uncharacterized protein YdiU (UPF0061 family)